MPRFVIEHLPRNAARYLVLPMDYTETKVWLAEQEYTSLIRTTELIAAVEAGMGVRLTQSDVPMFLSPGDEAVLISLSFGVLLASAEGDIPPLPEDWRCCLITVDSAGEALQVSPVIAVEEPFSTEAAID